MVYCIQPCVSFDTNYSIHGDALNTIAKPSEIITYFMEIIELICFEPIDHVGVCFMCNNWTFHIVLTTKVNRYRSQATPHNRVILFVDKVICNTTLYDRMTVLVLLGTTLLREAISSSQEFNNSDMLVVGRPLLNQRCHENGSS